VSTVGAITRGVTAEKLLNGGYADAVIVGRGFLRNPGLVWAWADELADYDGKISDDLREGIVEEKQGIQVQLANQIRWGFKGRGKKTSDGKEDHAKDGKGGDKHTSGAKI
jgi:tRNA-dihydrouridine synthase